jgi:hypothetical protein
MWLTIGSLQNKRMKRHVIRRSEISLVIQMLAASQSRTLLHGLLQSPWRNRVSKNQQFYSHVDLAIVHWLRFFFQTNFRELDLILHVSKTLITNKCTKRVLSSIVTHSYMFRPGWVIFRESFFVIVTLWLHFIVEWECAVDCVLRCFWRRELCAVPACTALQCRPGPHRPQKVLPEDDPAGSKHVGVCYDWW